MTVKRRPSRSILRREKGLFKRYGSAFYVAPSQILNYSGWLMGCSNSTSTRKIRESTTWNRRDIARDKTWAIPWTELPCKEKPPLQPVVLAQLPDGQEVMTKDHLDMGVLAEGQTWKETVIGTRLSAAVSDDLERGKHLMKGAQTISLSEYRKMHPEGTCDWWTNEAKTGTSIVSAEEREGLVDRSLVSATTPPGWTWVLVDGFVTLVRETSAT